MQYGKDNTVKIKPGAVLDPAGTLMVNQMRALQQQARKAVASGGLGAQVEYIRIMQPNLPPLDVQPNCSCHCGCS